jgi:hypothetical protein
VSFRTGMIRALLGTAVALVFAAPAAATIVRTVDFAEQCAGADAIVVGTVRDVVSRRVPAAPTFFETLVTINVDQVVAGPERSEVTMRLAGGQVGVVRQSIDGMPEFAVGERYVVFLDRDQDPPLVSPIVGFNQGLYRVERVDGADVVRDHAGRGLSEPTMAALSVPAAASTVGGTGVQSQAAPATPAPSLEQFLAVVRAARPR